MNLRVAARTCLQLAAAIGLASCATSPPPPPPGATTHTHAAAPAPDWFHRQLAAARYARSHHQPATDTRGARKAYLAIMLPACERVAKSGPDKYRSRCRGILNPPVATTTLPAKTLAPPVDQSCDLDRDDSADAPAQVTACSD